jgi:hypothetical protein
VKGPSSSPGPRFRAYENCLSGAWAQPNLPDLPPFAASRNDALSSWGFFTGSFAGVTGAPAEVAFASFQNQASKPMPPWLADIFIENGELAGPFGV